MFQLRRPQDRVQTSAALVCVECRREWVDPQARWRLLLTDDDPPAPVAYCDRCAEFEFGSRS